MNMSLRLWFSFQFDFTFDWFINICMKLSYKFDWSINVSMGLWYKFDWPINFCMELSSKFDWSINVCMELSYWPPNAISQGYHGHCLDTESLSSEDIFRFKEYITSNYKIKGVPIYKLEAPRSLYSSPGYNNNISQ
jgi:hypothetical protein